MGRERVAVHGIARDALIVLGGLIREARINKGWTQQHLADVAGTSQRSVSLIERGSAAVSIGTVFNVATSAGVNLFQIDDPEEMARLRYRGQEKIALMPKRVEEIKVSDGEFDF